MKRYFIFLMLALVWQFSRAQPMQLKFDHYAEKEGLPDALIISMSQDDQGYVWISTERGVAKYDGFKFQTLWWNSKYKEEGIVGAISMIADEPDHLWFNSWSGIVKYNRIPDNFTYYQFHTPDGQSVPTNTVEFFFADDKGYIWGTELADKKLRPVKFNTRDDRFTSAGWGKTMSGGIVLTAPLFRPRVPGGRVWAGTKNGLYFYDQRDDNFHPWFTTTDTIKQKTVIAIKGAATEPDILWLSVVDHRTKQTSIERVDTRNKTVRDFSHITDARLNASNDTLNDVYQDKQRRLWLATQRGLMLFNPQQFSFTPFIPHDGDRDIDKNRFSKITRAKDGSLWMVAGKTGWAGAGNGIINFDPVSRGFKRYFSRPGDPYSLSEGPVSGLLIDHSGVLWVSKWTGGVNRADLNGSAFQIYPAKITNGIASSASNNIAVSTDGYLWYSNNEVIYKWKPGTGQPKKVYGTKKSESLIDPICIARDSSVFFSNGKGMQVYDPARRTLQSYIFKQNDPASISNDIVNYILEDHAGMIWVGTEDGLCAFDRKKHKFIRYPDKDNHKIVNKYRLEETSVTRIYEDREGALWVLTINGGLNRFDRATGTFENFYWYDKLPVGTNNVAFEDSRGRLWIGNFNSGLLEFDRRTGRYTRLIDEKRGLAFNDVSDINEDSRGFLWVSTVRGLSRIDPDNFSVKNYPINSILPGKSIVNSLDLKKASAGKLLLELSDGIAVFDPRNLDGNPYPPVVNIEKIAYSDPTATDDTTFSQNRYGLNQFELPYNKNKITFNYVAIHFVSPQQNKYTYRLENYDKHWVQAGAQRSVTYNNLSPGTYTFRVKAANSDGVWNNKGDSFVIIIRPPWWQTWWAWMLWIILFVSAIYAFIAYRSRKLLHDKKVLEHKVQLRTEEVMQQKEEIESQRDNLEKAFGELKATQTQLIQSEKMASLGELTAGIAHEIQNPLNFVNNFSEVNKEMLEELKAESKKPKAERDERLEVELINDLIENEEKINHHGKRADSIVKGMLEHSRSRSGQKEPTDINTMADEFIRLSYHGLRSKDKSFNAELVTNFDTGLPKISVVQQDIGRVMLNLFNNAFYAVNQKAKTVGKDYKPEVTVTTSKENNQVIIKVKDNGIGIPDAIKDKIMQPFFTTKPTGEGTGLGLSLTYDMVVKGHGGSIDVNSKEGEGSEFIIQLPVS